MYKPLLNKAIALHQQGDFETALLLYQELLAKHPNVADAHHLMGVVHLELQQFDTAIASIQNKVIAIA